MDSQQSKIVLTICVTLFYTIVSISTVLLMQNSHIANGAENATSPNAPPMMTNATEGISSTPPEKTLLTESSEPPTFSEEIQANLAKEIDDTYSDYPKKLIRETAPPAEEILSVNKSTSTFPLAAPQTVNDSIFNKTFQSKMNVTQESSKSPLAASSFKIFRNAIVTPTVYRSNVMEPSVGGNGPIIFETGNWFAARSTNYGVSWNYVNPIGDMSDFCCDQDVVYDKNHKVFVWFRQGVSDNNGENRFRLGISKDALNWWFYNIKPATVNPSWKNNWFDYPQLTLGDKYVYVASNMFDQNSQYVRTILSRWDLNDLSSAAPVHFAYYWESQEFTFTPVQGATTTMYFAVHHSNSQMKIYKWPENTLSISIYTRNIPTWEFGTRNTMTCAGPDGLNWCGRSDSRITGGFVANGKVGWYWNAKQGSGFPFPYVNAATFQESTMSYIGRPLMWSGSVAWMYAYMAPRANGDLGVLAYYGGGSYNPSLGVGVVDVYSGSPPPYTMYNVVSSTNGSPRWGDYSRVRTWAGADLGPWWEASGYSMQGCSDNSCAEPRYVIFGRG
jgi:hypothetical protein